MLLLRRKALYAGVRAGARLLGLARPLSAVSTSHPSWVPPHNTLLEIQEVSCDAHKNNSFIGTWNAASNSFDYRTYGQFGEDVDRFRTVLARRGVGKNDKVAIISNNREEWAVSYYAANGRGAQVIPLYEAQTEKDWRFILQNSDTKLAVVANRRIYDTVVSYMGKDFPKLESVICLDPTEENIPSYRTLVSEIRAEDVIPSLPAESDDLTAIVYTSGSTGFPKGVCLTHGNIVANIKGWLLCAYTNIFLKALLRFLQESPVFGARRKWRKLLPRNLSVSFHGLTFSGLPAACMYALLLVRL